MLRTNPDKQWERFGREDPYYGVISRQELRGSDLDEDLRTRFFASGEDEIGRLMESLKHTFEAELTIRKVLDYGCGVGRLLIPLARRSESAVGIDISPSMLAEAGRNCAAQGVDAVELLQVEALDRLPEETFDLVHSSLVLQHIPVRQGERIVARLARLLRRGGLGALHLQVGASRRVRAYNAAMRLPAAHNLANVLRRRPWSYPHMEMNVYDLGRLLLLLRDASVPATYTHVADQLGGYDPCMLLFRRV